MPFIVIVLTFLSLPERAGTPPQFLSLPERAGTPPQFAVRHRARRVIESGDAVLHTRLGARSAEWRPPHTILATESRKKSKRRTAGFSQQTDTYDRARAKGMGHIIYSLDSFPFERTGNEGKHALALTFGSDPHVGVWERD